NEAVTYTLGHQPALSTGFDTFTPAFTSAAASVTFSSPTIRLNGDHRGRSEDGVAFAVTITPPPEVTGARVFGGYITLTPDDGGQVLSVPYLGYNGDYQAIQVFTLAGFPLLASQTPTGFVPQPNGASFSLQGDDVPFVLLHLNHQVANLKVEVIDTVTNRSMGFADDEDFLPRNSAANTFFALPWDGTTMKRAGGERK